MKPNNSYVYFAFKGDNFDPNEITERIGIKPTEIWRKGDKGKHHPSIEYSGWQLSSEKGQEKIEIDILVDQVVSMLYDKMEIINELKVRFNLESVLEVVMDVDINAKTSLPALGHNSKTIEFLFKTKTTTDIEIYRFNSEYNYKKTQKKLLFILGSLSVLNIILLMLGNGLGGNYMKNMDSILWLAPLGCTIWGFILGILFALCSYKELSYSKKYLIISLFISIVLNGFILLGALMMLLN
jgi:hypothetical protein